MYRLDNITCWPIQVATKKGEGMREREGGREEGREGGEGGEGGRGKEVLRNGN